MNINSHAYRQLHPRGKKWRRDRMPFGGLSVRARFRKAQREAEPQGPTAESKLTNHQRHVMRRKAREMILNRAKELEAASAGA